MPSSCLRLVAEFARTQLRAVFFDPPCVIDEPRFVRRRILFEPYNPSLTAHGGCSRQLMVHQRNTAGQAILRR